MQGIDFGHRRTLWTASDNNISKYIGFPADDAEKEDIHYAKTSISHGASSLSCASAKPLWISTLTSQRVNADKNMLPLPLVYV